MWTLCCMRDPHLLALQASLSLRLCCAWLSEMEGVGGGVSSCNGVQWLEVKTGVQEAHMRVATVLCVCCMLWRCLASLFCTSCGCHTTNTLLLPSCCVAKNAGQPHEESRMVWLIRKCVDLQECVHAYRTSLAVRACDVGERPMFWTRGEPPCVAIRILSVLGLEVL